MLETLLLSFVITISIAGFVYLARIAREISQNTKDISAIQRAIFLQLRKQYQDIDNDLRELANLVKSEA
jgi:hypothetical protein